MSPRQRPTPRHTATDCDVVMKRLLSLSGVRLSSVAEDTIRAYFESRLMLLEPVFPLACHRLCEGPDFSFEFGFKAPPQPEGTTPRCKHLVRTLTLHSHFLFLARVPSRVPGSGILLFIFHANFLNEITARLCGPCSVHAVVLNDKFQLPIFLVGSKQTHEEDMFCRGSDKTHLLRQ